MSCGQPHMIPLPPVDDTSQTGRLADELAMQIHLGQLKPGAPLRELDLSAQHKVSRTIVRAALQRLEAQGLAESAANKGAKVRAVSAEAVADMIELQAHLTALAARHAAGRASKAQISRIDQFADMMEHVAEDEGPPHEFQHLRVGFARALFDAAGPVLAERLRTAAPAIPHHERAMDDISTRAGMTEAARLANAVLKAVQKGDADAAALAAEMMVRRHGERALGRTAKRRPARTD
jgi:DNA-binding GntR family transcriptional regulator